MRSRGSTAPSRALSSVVLPGSGAAGDQQREPGREHGTQQRVRSGAESPRPAQRAQVVGSGPEHAQRQAGAVGRDGWQDGVQPHPGFGEPSVDARARVVQAPTGGKGEPLGQPPDGGLVGEPHGRGLEPRSPVHPHRSLAAHQDVRGAGVAQQLVQRARTDELLAQQPQRGQDVQVGRHAAGLGAHRRRDRGW